MNIYLSHISAWLFWIWWSKMNAIPLGLFHSGKCFARDRMPSFSLPTVSIIKNAAGSKREVRQILNANGQSVRQLLVRAGIGTGADGCLYVCVPYVKGRRCSEKNIHFHQVSCALPRRSFVKVAEGLYVASPELTFVQMASVLEEGALCACGMELTGGYPLDAEFRPDGEVVYVRAPVTSQTLLAAYADRYQGRGGTNKARSATLSSKNRMLSWNTMVQPMVTPKREQPILVAGMPCEQKATTWLRSPTRSCRARRNSRRSSCRPRGRRERERATSPSATCRAIGPSARKSPAITQEGFRRLSMPSSPSRRYW